MGLPRRRTVVVFVPERRQERQPAPALEPDAVKRPVTGRQGWPRPVRPAPETRR